VVETLVPDGADVGLAERVAGVVDGLPAADQAQLGQLLGLFESRLVPERITYEDDDRLPQWGFGVTNLVARPTPGIDTLRRDEYAAGVGVLRRKVRRWQPKVVAFVGVTLYRAIFDVRGGVALGLQRERLDGARVFVLPNPSGRNANYSYREMLAAFTRLRRLADRL